MKEQFHIVLITVGLFVAGLLMGIWTQKTKPIPPPPAPVFGEFGLGQTRAMVTRGFGPAEGGFAIGRFSPGHAATIVTMNRNTAELEPKIRAFQSAVNGIEKDFREKLDKVLTPEEQKELSAIEAEEAPVTVGVGPLPPPDAEVEGQAPLPGAEPGPQVAVGVHPPFPIGGWLMMSMIVYQPSLEHLTGELKLDAKQQAAVKDLMVERRTKLLALIDRNPPPTLGFGGELP